MHHSDAFGGGAVRPTAAHRMRGVPDKPTQDNQTPIDSK